MKRLLLITTLIACQDSLEEDSIDDTFLDDGKTDTGGVRENSTPGYAVLHHANTADLAELDGPTGLSSLTAQNIVAHRAGADGALGTADDDPFDNLAELDAVPYVGPVAFQKLLARATALGYITFDWRTHISNATWSSANPTICTVAGPVDAKELRLLFDEKQSATWRIDLRDTSGTLVQSIKPPFSGWSNPIQGNRVTYAIYFGGAYANCKDFRSLAQAYAAREPVAVDDPFKCTTFATMSMPTPMGAMAGELGMFALPNVNLFENAFPGSCSTSKLMLQYTPPTDGLYTFKSFDKRYVTIHAGGCAGPELACDGTETKKVKLEAGKPIAIGVASNEQSFTWVTVVRAKLEVSCTDGFDDNGDGKVDCADPTCATACAIKEICDNGIDDNANGQLDCLDPGCASAATCAANTCPGVDIGSATSSTAPVAGGNTSLSPAEQYLVCDTSVTWQGSRFFEWRAPAAGTYRFTVDSPPLYHTGIKILDGTCDGDVLACGTRTGGTSNAVVTLAANQPVVIEAGLSRYSMDPNTPFTLAIKLQ